MTAQKPPDEREPAEHEPDEHGPDAHGRHERHGRWLSGRHASAAVIGVLTLVLGFAIVIQVRATSDDDNLAGLREDDLIGILDNQNARAERLRQQAATLQETLNRLRDSDDRSAVARQQAQQEARALGVLLGTLPATGPGVSVSVADADNSLDGEALLDVVQELRGAGAEAITFGDDSHTVRVSTTTSFDGGGGRVSVDSTRLSAPYRVVAIGDPATLDTALNIPGGIAATVRLDGGELTVRQRTKLVITATRPLPDSSYVKPR